MEWLWRLLIQVTAAKIALDKDNWQHFSLIEKTPVSSNTAIYRFELPTQEHILGLPIGQHISVQAEINGKNIMRSYTPVSSDDDKGYFDLMIKSYPQGNISKYIGEMNVGDTLEVKGPKGQMIYTPGLCKSIGMIAGGTGITPMLQIIRAIVKNKSDQTKVSLLFANVNECDILLKDELDDLAAQYPEQFHIYYVLNNAPANWKGGEGFVTKDMMSEHLPSANEEKSKLLMCGPPPMISAMKKQAEELGFPKARAVSKLEDQVFCF